MVKISSHVNLSTGQSKQTQIVIWVILEPLSKAWPPIVAAGIDVELLTLMAVGMRSRPLARVGDTSATIATEPSPTSSGASTPL